MESLLCLAEFSEDNMTCKLLNQVLLGLKPMPWTKPPDGD